MVEPFDNPDAVKRVIDEIPPTSIFPRAAVTRILELMDLRKQKLEEIDLAEDRDYEILVTQLDRRRKQVESYVLLGVLGILRGVSLLASKFGLVKRQNWERLGQLQDEVSEATERALRRKDHEFSPQRDEIEAGELYDQGKLRYQRLEQSYGAENPRIEAYIAHHRETALWLGQENARVEIQARRLRFQAARDAEMYRLDITSFGAMVSLAVLIKDLAVALILALSIYYFADFVRADPTEEVTKAVRVMSAVIAAILTLAMTWVIRLYFNLRRMKGIERDTRRRIAEARLNYLLARLHNRRQAWIQICTAYTTLTGHAPPADANAAQEERELDLNEQIDFEKLEVERNSGKLNWRKRLRSMVDGGAGQGGIEDLF